MEFDWDPEKRLRNFLKHGVDFYAATGLFQSYCLLEVDRRKDYGEVRWIAIGPVAGAVLHVTFTDRVWQGRVVRRIISARRASKNERKKFHASSERYDRLGPRQEHD